MNSAILFVEPAVFEMNSPTGYAIGAVIALVILGYLVYSLIKPERF
jgi:K+-transporting ATPase KdpF subunit